MHSIERENYVRDFKDRGLLFNIQRFSLHDGPGIRTNIFFKGCPLKCWWCCNPEGQGSSIDYFIFQDKCEHNCDICIKSCKQNAISRINNKVVIDYSKCTVCDSCINVCPKSAIQRIGKYYNLDPLIEEVLKDIKIFKKSGGGVTFTGGEPTMQVNFLRNLTKKLKNLGINLCLETCGYFNYLELLDILKEIDIIIYDLKFFNCNDSILYTGAEDDRILTNLLKLTKELNNEIIIRIPLIPNLTATKNNLKLIRNFLIENEINKKIELLPYHKFGIKKYEFLGREYKLGKENILSEVEIKSFLRIFKGFIVKIQE